MPNHVTNINAFKGVSEEQPEEKIKVVLVKPMQKPQIVEIGTSLEAMQKTVCGLIEQVMPFDEEVALVCNEEGKNDGLELNRALKYPDGEIADIIAGNFFPCTCDNDHRQHSHCAHH
jgi:hypothetical protein